jgi:hypothetical protein
VFLTAVIDHPAIALAEIAKQLQLSFPARIRRPTPHSSNAPELRQAH